MKKDVKNIVEAYKYYTWSDLKVKKHPGAPGTTLSKSGLE